MSALAQPSAGSPKRALLWAAAVIPLVVLLCLPLSTGTIRPLVYVLSGSMEPQIATHDVVLVESLRGRDPRPGDVVLVHVPAREQTRLHYPARLLHRVVQVRDGKVTTKGDGLSAPDPFTTPVSDVGVRYVAVVPVLGSIVAACTGPLGLPLLIVVSMLLALAISRRPDLPQPTPTVGSTVSPETDPSALLARLESDVGELRDLLQRQQTPPAPPHDQAGVRASTIG